MNIVFGAITTAMALVFAAVVLGIAAILLFCFWPLALGVVGCVYLEPINYNLAMASIIAGIVGQIAWISSLQ